VECFLGGLALGKGRGLGRAHLFSGGRGLPFIMDPTTRGKPASIFLSVRTLGDQHQDKALRTLAHRLHHTHTRFQRQRRFSMSTTPPQWNRPHHTLYQHTFARAAVMASRGTDDAAGGKVLVERNITPTLLAPPLPSSTVPFAAASTSPAFQPGGSRHIAPQRRMTMMKEGNKMGIPGFYDECYLVSGGEAAGEQAELQT
jgi:hypothetical protein